MKLTICWNLGSFYLPCNPQTSSIRSNSPLLKSHNVCLSLWGGGLLHTYTDCKVYSDQLEDKHVTIGGWPIQPTSRTWGTTQKSGRTLSLYGDDQNVRCHHRLGTSFPGCHIALAANSHGLPDEKLIIGSRKSHGNPQRLDFSSSAFIKMQPRGKQIIPTGTYKF